jgi:AcrR family transcriptional regulator
MDNRTRSERSREAVLQAALAIIVRDGVGRLTLDAIAKESGMSKGGVMHQFHSKEAVVTALLERQSAKVDALAEHYIAAHGAGRAQPQLAARIAAAREAINGPAYSISFAIHGLLAQDPKLLAISRQRDAASLAAIRAETSDPDLATLRWLAARGLVQLAMVGPNPLSEEERERLFARLLDDKSWAAHTASSPG